MARVIFALNLRQTLHSIARTPWTIVGTVFGLLYAAGAIVAVLALATAARALLAADDRAGAVIATGAIGWLLWLVIAVIIGLQQSTGPEQLCLLPVTPRQLGRGMLLAGLVSITGIGYAVALAGLWIVWSDHPGAFGAAVISWPLTLVLWFLLVRLITDGLAAQLARRRVREIVLGALVLAVVSSGFTVQLIVSGVTRAAAAGDARVFSAVTAVLQWLPPVAPVALPGAIASGNLAQAAGLLAVTLASLGGAWLAWSRMLAARLTAPIQQAGGGHARALGWLDRLWPATPWGAIAGRRVRYVLRDSRHQLNFASTLLCAGIAVLLPRILGVPEVTAAITPFLPLLVSLALLSIALTELAYDGEALSADLFAGVTGRADRLGRIAALALLYVPVTLVTAVLVPLVTGHPERLAATVGVSLGGSLVAIGTGLAIGALLPGSAPPPGGNPFGRGSSGDAQTLLATVLGVPVCTLLNLPAIGLAIAGFWHPWAGWAALGAGAAVGVGVIWASAAVSARWVERRAPEILAHVRRTA